MKAMWFKTLVIFGIFWCVFFAQSVSLFYCMQNTPEQQAVLGYRAVAIWFGIGCLAAFSLAFRARRIDSFLDEYGQGRKAPDDVLLATADNQFHLPMFSATIYAVAWLALHLVLFYTIRAHGIGKLAAASIWGGGISGALACPLMVYGSLSMVMQDTKGFFARQLNRNGLTPDNKRITIKRKLLIAFVLFGLGLVIWLGWAAFYTGFDQMVRQSKSAQSDTMEMVADNIRITLGDSPTEAQLVEYMAKRSVIQQGMFLADESGKILLEPRDTQILLAQVEDLQPEWRNASGRQAISIYRNTSDQVVSVCRLNGKYLIGMVTGLSRHLDRFDAFWFWFAFYLVVGLTVGFTIAFTFIADASKMITNTADRLRSLAQAGGDLTVRLEKTSEDEVGDLVTSFNAFVQHIRDMINHISVNSTSLGGASAKLTELSREVAENAVNMSQRSENVSFESEQMHKTMSAAAGSMKETTQSINMISVAIEEITTTVNDISDNAAQARGITVQAVSQSTKAREIVDLLGQAAQEIGKVTEVITEISDQTNLLALNATIEAARAGESGKGFTVVANEIKELARQTAGATVQIKKRIQDMQRSATDCVHEIKSISGTIGNVSDIVGTIATAVEQQSGATREVAGSIATALQGINETNTQIAGVSRVTETMSGNASEVSRSAGRISDTSLNLDKQAESLLSLADLLRAMVQNFKT